MKGYRVNRLRDSIVEVGSHPMLMEARFSIFLKCHRLSISRVRPSTTQHRSNPQTKVSRKRHQTTTSTTLQAPPTNANQPTTPTTLKTKALLSRRSSSNNRLSLMAHIMRESCLQEADLRDTWITTTKILSICRIGSWSESKKKRWGCEGSTRRRWGDNSSLRWRVGREKLEEEIDSHSNVRNRWNSSSIISKWGDRIERKASSTSWRNNSTTSLKFSQHSLNHSSNSTINNSTINNNVLSHSRSSGCNNPNNSITFSKSSSNRPSPNPAHPADRSQSLSKILVRSVCQDQASTSLESTSSNLPTTRWSVKVTLNPFESSNNTNLNRCRGHRITWASTAFLPSIMAARLKVTWCGWVPIIRWFILRVYRLGTSDSHTDWLGIFWILFSLVHINRKKNNIWCIFYWRPEGNAELVPTESPTVKFDHLCQFPILLGCPVATILCSALMFYYKSLKYLQCRCQLSDVGHEWLNWLLLLICYYLLSKSNIWESFSFVCLCAAWLQCKSPRMIHKET